VSGLIREADATAARIVGDARQDAERMTIEARTDADRIRTDAQARAEQERAAAEAAVREARAEADRTVAGLAVRRDALVEQLGSMQERLLAVARDLERTIDIDGPPTPTFLAEDASTTALEPAVEDQGEDADAPTVTAEASSPPSEPVPEPSVSASTAAEPARYEDEGSSVTPSDPPRQPDIVIYEDVDEVDYEELWAGTQAMRLEVPEIPALDLDWGADRGDHPEDDLDDDLRD
jgi:hypothetical protein